MSVSLVTQLGVEGHGDNPESDIRRSVGRLPVHENRDIQSISSVDREVIDYAVRIIRATRDWQGISVGAGPRGGISLIRAARAAARGLARGGLARSHGWIHENFPTHRAVLS